MGVGPPGRTGRDQIDRVRAFLAEPARARGEVIAIACEHGAGRVAGVIRREGAVLYPVTCAGNLHTSAVELLLRGGAGGVLVLPCHSRDCRNRVGPKWLRERMYEGREAELQERVDRRRIAIAYAGAGEAGRVAAAVRELSERVLALDRPTAEARPEPDTTCEPAPPLPREVDA